jgi:Uma2 family endonuclease
MNAILEKPSFTPEDLLELPDGKRFELVDGQLVEKPMSALSSWIGGRLYKLLSNHCDPEDLGWIWPGDCGFQCFPGAPNKVRKPDVAFVARGRLTIEQLAVGHLRLAPDLAVEVVSLNDLFEEVDKKVEEYLQAGVKLVWVVCPATRQVYAHRADGTVTKMREHQELTGGDVVPGFRCQVRDLFPREMTQAPPATNGPAAP